MSCSGLIGFIGSIGFIGIGFIGFIGFKGFRVEGYFAGLLSVPKKDRARKKETVSGDLQPSTVA